MKLVITWLMFVLLAGTAVYSWNTLHFGDRMTVFFSRYTGADQNAFPGRGRFDARRGDGGSERGGWRGSAVRREDGRMARRHEERGRHGRGRETVALGNVMLYSFILSFTAMATWQAEKLIRKLRKT